MRVSVCARRLEAAAECAAHYNIEHFKEDSAGVDLFVNAAPIGETPLDQVPFLLNALRGVRAVFDHEMPGDLLRAHCQQAGIHYMAGRTMYMPQMRAQWSLLLKPLLSAAQFDDLPRMLLLAEEQSTASKETRAGV